MNNIETITNSIYAKAILELKNLINDSIEYEAPLELLAFDIVTDTVNNELFKCSYKLSLDEYNQLIDNLVNTNKNIVNGIKKQASLNKYIDNKDNMIFSLANFIIKRSQMEGVLQQPGWQQLLAPIVALLGPIGAALSSQVLIYIIAIALLITVGYTRKEEIRDYFDKSNDKIKEFLGEESAKEVIARENFDKASEIVVKNWDNFMARGLFALIVAAAKGLKDKIFGSSPNPKKPEERDIILKRAQDDARKLARELEDAQLKSEDLANKSLDKLTKNEKYKIELDSEDFAPIKKANASVESKVDKIVQAAIDAKDLAPYKSVLDGLKTFWATGIAPNLIYQGYIDYVTFVYKNERQPTMLETFGGILFEILKGFFWPLVIIYQSFSKSGDTILSKKKEFKLIKEKIDKDIGKYIKEKTDNKDIIPASQPTSKSVQKISNIEDLLKMKPDDIKLLDKNTVQNIVNTFSDEDLNKLSPDQINALQDIYKK